MPRVILEVRVERLEVLEGLRAARAAGEGAAIATVVNVIGSAYRREGAAMLVREDGGYVCMVSGGCLEPEIVYLASEVLRDGRPRVQRYNLDEERMFGLGIGCAGEVDLYIEAVTDDPLLARWHRAWADDELAALVTRLDGSGPDSSGPDDSGADRSGLGGPESRTFVTLSGAYGTLGAVQAAAEQTARTRLAAPHPKAGLITLGGDRYFLDVNVPPPQLLLFGAAHDSVAVARLAHQAGFRVRVVDMRAALLRPERFPGAELYLLTPERFHELPTGPRTYAVVMNHHFLVDLASLRSALCSDAAYVGLLGPRGRLNKLVQNALDDGGPFSIADLARIHNPIGLSIGADTPEEVAVSIVSELLAHSRGFSGAPLNGHTGQIHTPEQP